MARPMFNYTKVILRKVSFDVKLFTKEVKKAAKHLLPHEIEELKEFIKSLFAVNPELRVALVYLEN